MINLVNNILVPIFYSLIVFHVALVIGFFALSRIKSDFKDKVGFAGIVGLSALLGYGILGYCSLIMTLFGPLNKFFIFFIFLVILIVGYKYIKFLYNGIFSIFKSFKNWILVDKLLFLLISLLFLFYLTSALVPPYRTDALVYHLPEAMEMAENGFWFNGLIDGFFKNLPILMETFYALLYTISGFTLINLAHFQVLLSALLFVYPFISKEFGRRSAIVGIILIFSIYELFVNATNAYVDAATVAFELAGILLFFWWHRFKQREFLILAGAFFGLALSTKYLTFYTLLLVAGYFVVFSLFNKDSLKKFFINILYLSVPIIILGGFWYIKNLIFFGNPIWPFIFGHEGWSDAGLESAVLAIKHFIPRTVHNFVLFPFILFSGSYYLTVLAGFLVFPLFLFTKYRKNKIFINLLLFVIFYFTMWFFFISHTARFAMTGMVILMLLTGIIIVALAEKFSFFFKYKVFWLAVVVFMLLAGYKIATYKDNYFLKVKEAEIGYALGLKTKQEFYQERGLGSIYTVSEYINNNYHDKKIINNWSVLNIFLRNNNEYYAVPFETFIKNDIVPWPELCQYLKNDNLELFFLDEEEKDRVLQDYWRNQDPEGVKQQKNKLIVEEVILENSIPVFDGSEGYLYKVNFNCEG